MSPDLDFFAEADTALYRWRTEGRVIAARERELFALLTGGLPPPRRVLALGLGEGSDCMFMEEAWPQAEFFGADLFPANMAHAAQHHPRWRLFAGDALRLPLADACCDVVYAKDLLHHVPDPAQALAEMWRVVQPGGHLGLIEVCGRNPVSCLLAATARHERGILRNSASRLKGWLREVTGQEPECHMAHALPLWRMVFHYRFGRPAWQEVAVIRSTVSGTERIVGCLVPRPCHFYAVLRVAKS